MLAQTVHRHVLANRTPRILYDGPGTDGCHLITNLRSIITGNHGRCSVVKVANKIFVDILSALLKRDPKSRHKLNPKVYAFSRGCISFYLAMEYLCARLDRDMRSKIGTIDLVSIDPMLGPEVFSRSYQDDLKSLCKASDNGALGFEVREIVIVSNEPRLYFPIPLINFNPVMSPIKNSDVLFFDGNHARFRFLAGDRELAGKVITDCNKVSDRRFFCLQNSDDFSFRDVFKKSKRSFIEKYLPPKKLSRYSFQSEALNKLRDSSDDCGLELFVEGTKFGNINPGYITKQYDHTRKVASRGVRVIKSLGWARKRKSWPDKVPQQEQSLKNI